MKKGYANHFSDLHGPFLSYRKILLFVSDKKFTHILLLMTFRLYIPPLL